MTMLDEARRCSATRRDGEPCSAPALPSSGEQHCFAHDAGMIERLAVSRAAGGRGRARAARADKLMPASLRPLLDLLMKSADEVHRGDLTPPQATALAALAGAVVKVMTAGMVEERLAQLEAQSGGVRAS